VKQKAEHIHHHQTVLLHQLQALEMVEVYREWCYQFYLASLTYNPLSKASTITGKSGKTIGTHVEKIDETYSINKKNPKYKQTYNRYFHMDALGSITAVTDDQAKVVERRSYDAFGKIRSMDYGLDSSHAIIPANTVSQTSRAYTGHEQIKEIDGLIHMNARVYDSEIGRFLSADTVIQNPYDSQAYNRYSYVRNNPMVFTDPTGHSWLSKAWKKAKHWVKKHARAIGAIVAAAVVTVVAPYLLPAMGSYATAAATGALAGAASGAIQTKSLKGALKGALYGALGAVAAVGVVQVTAKVFNITKTLAHSSNFINSGINKLTAFKAGLHGLARGAIQSLQGGSFKAGFMSGLSSGFDVGTKAFGSGAGGFIARSTAMGIVGGTASALGGGKFSNGAMSGAFTHMFNSEARGSILKRLANNISNNNDVDSKIRSRLKSVLKQDKLFYKDSTDGPKGWKQGVYRGYSRNGNRMYLTSALFNGDTLNELQAVTTTIHEITHKVWVGDSSNHPAGFYESVNRNVANYYGDNGDLF